MGKSVKVHSCTNRIDGYIEKRCNCRKFLPEDKAKELVGNGSADYIKTDYKIIQVEVQCPVCDNTGMRKSCRVCSGTGKVLQEKDVFEYGEDIYMTPAKKTPRTATIESEHIFYAFIKQDKDALKRIELYNELNQLSLVNLGAELKNSKTGEVVIPGTPEPENGPKKGTGRDVDYGRTI